MRSNHAARLVSVLALALLARCAAPQGGARDTPAPSPDTTYHFVEGDGAFTCAVNDRVVLTVQARAGRLYCNGVDTGPYRPGAPVRFVSASTFVVDGEQRPIPPAERSGS